MMQKKDVKEIYGEPRGRAKIKVLSSLEKHSENFIKHSPFVVISTYDADGNVDTSPRGGFPGFVKITNSNQIIIPDAKGNNRVDSLGNIAETNRIGMLFLIPGIDETLRINGKAILTQDPEILDSFEYVNHPPKTCIIVDIEEAFLHCAKALMRSKLWGEEYKVERKDFPTMGKMLNEQLKIKTDTEESQAEMVERYKPDL